MLQALERFPADGGDLALGHDVERHDVGQAAALHELHHHPQLAGAQIAVDEVHNVWVGAVLHDQDLVDDQVLLGLLLQVHLLDGHQPVAALLVAGKHAARGALADLGEAPVYVAGVAFGADLLEPRHHVDPGALARPMPRPGCRRGSAGLRLLGWPWGASVGVGRPGELVLGLGRGRLLGLGLSLAGGRGPAAPTWPPGPGPWPAPAAGA